MYHNIKLNQNGLLPFLNSVTVYKLHYNMSVDDNTYYYMTVDDNSYYYIMNCPAFSLVESDFLSTV